MKYLTNGWEKKGVQFCGKNIISKINIISEVIQHTRGIFKMLKELVHRLDKFERVKK